MEVSTCDSALKGTEQRGLEMAEGICRTTGRLTETHTINELPANSCDVLQPHPSIAVRYNVAYTRNRPGGMPGRFV